MALVVMTYKISINHSCNF